MKNKIYSHIPAIMFGVLVISFLAVFYVLAWTEPSVAPPGGNVPVPLNVSINAQSKEGALVVGTNSAVTTGLIVQNGNVGIGTTDPGVYKLNVAGGVGALINEGINLNVRMTAQGSQTAVQAVNDAADAFAVLRVDGSTLLLNAQSNGNVGIGTTTPSEKLDVAGNINVMGDVKANNLWMKIAEVDVSASKGVTITSLNGNVQKMYRVVFQGFLSAVGSDRRILIRPNGATTGYRTFTAPEGDYGGVGEWELTGFYVGRNGWNLDADVAFEYAISAITGRKRMCLNGNANFSFTDGRFLSYTSYGGYWGDTSTNITSLWIGPTGGTITGKLMIFALQ